MLNTSVQTLAMVHKSLFPRGREPGLVQAGLVAALFSGAPSTVHALLTGADPLAATRAAGAMFVATHAPPSLLLSVALGVHLTISAFWTVVLSRVLPARHTYLWAAAWGIGIALLDLLLIGRLFPSVRALPFLPQLADHLAFTWLVAFVLRRERCRVAG